MQMSYLLVPFATPRPWKRGKRDPRRVNWSWKTTRNHQYRVVAA